MDSKLNIIGGINGKPLNDYIMNHSNSYFKWKIRQHFYCLSYKRVGAKLNGIRCQIH